MHGILNKLKIQWILGTRQHQAKMKSYQCIEKNAISIESICLSILHKKSKRSARQYEARSRYFTSNKMIGPCETRKKRMKMRYAWRLIACHNDTSRIENEICAIRNKLLLNLFCIDSYRLLLFAAICTQFI